MVRILLRIALSGIALLCVVAQLCLGEAGTAKTGIGIFDTLFIAENGTLRIHGNVYLKQAHVLGEGRLLVQGESQSKIVADHSEVNNLEITTHTTISLEGELAVNQSLTVQSGIFDISAGKLYVSDSTAIQLNNRGSILQNAHVTSLPVRSSHSQQIELSGKAILTPLPIREKSFSANGFQQYDEAASHPLLVYRDVPSIPPEGIKSVSVFF
jgi:hypothetical protein